MAFDTPFATHEVTNQVPTFYGRNLFHSDPLLIRLAQTFLETEVLATLMDHGRLCGAAESFEMARLANHHEPTLRTHDGQGRRVDQVDYHPAYHALMRRSFEAGLHCEIWDAENPADGQNEGAGYRHFSRAIKVFMTAQYEMGHLCPVIMTSAALAALRSTPDLMDEWLPRVRTRQYDHRFLPPEQKAGVTLGMGMTEKQGGTDVRANTTYAVLVNSAANSGRKPKPDSKGLWRIVGHKWFFSAPMCDAFLILAQTGEQGKNKNGDGQSCFLVPRHLPDGEINALHLQRLKSKVGNRSNASSEVEFKGAGGYLVGKAGEGVKTILEMVSLTRLDCAVSSAGLMRFALASAVHHCRHRSVFGGSLIDKPLMESVLADMTLESAAALALVMRLARAFDRQSEDGTEAAYARLMTPAIKYWVCKIAPGFVNEAMECIGGNGYVEDSDIARAYREAPLNAIWEGSGNVMCLDVLRVLVRQPDALSAVIASFEVDFGQKHSALTDVLLKLADASLEDSGTARILTEQLAITAAAAALHAAAPGTLSEAFLVTRLGGQWRSTYGMLDSRFDARSIVDAICPSEQ